VLVCGETGTGKELIARGIHYLSGRRNKPFVPVDCAAIPAELAESELFGHERGAFTGAVARTAGLVDAACDGTIFLDEVDALPLSVQAKLLRFLQQKEYRCLGSTHVKKADVRVISATNSDLRERMQSGQFREDLFYRLNVLQLRLPPLRERLPDIADLAEHFITKYRAEFDRLAQGLSGEALQKLLLHPWPGNVRELENVIQAAVALCEGPAIQASDIHFSVGERAILPSFRQAKAEAVTEFEKNYIERLLRATRGNVSEAARAAKKHRRAFWELMRKYQIETKQFKAAAGERPAPVPPVKLPNRRAIASESY
jgi:two-component system, NtrC family, response regulator GlrR